MVLEPIKFVHPKVTGVRPAQKFVGLQSTVVLASRVPRAGSTQQFVGLQREALVLLDGCRARVVQQFVRFEGHGVLRPGVARQGAAKGPVRLGHARVLGFHGARTSPSQQLVGFGDAVLSRFQFRFVFSTAWWRITGRPLEDNREDR